MKMKSRKDSRLALTPRRILIIAIIWSLLSTAATLAYLRMSRAPDVQPVERPNEFPQAPVSETPPPHFTENIIVPGFTETGEQIMEQDAEQGWSPEGV